MKAKKTIQVAQVKEFGNDILLRSSDEYTKQRWGICSMIEKVLHETGNYRGFNYLTENHMKLSQGKSVGMKLDKNGKPDFTDCDETRRFYF